MYMGQYDAVDYHSICQKVDNMVLEMTSTPVASYLCTLLQQIRAHTNKSLKLSNSWIQSSYPHAQSDEWLCTTTIPTPTPRSQGGITDSTYPTVSPLQCTTASGISDNSYSISTIYRRIENSIHHEKEVYQGSVSHHALIDYKQYLRYIK